MIDAGIHTDSETKIEAKWFPSTAGDRAFGTLTLKEGREILTIYIHQPQVLEQMAKGIALLREHLLGVAEKSEEEKSDPLSDGLQEFLKYQDAQGKLGAERTVVADFWPGSPTVEVRVPDQWPWEKRVDTVILHPNGEEERLTLAEGPTPEGVEEEFWTETSEISLEEAEALSPEPSSWERG